MKSNVVARLFVVLLACGSVWAQDPPSQQPVPNPAADAPAEAEQPQVTPPKPVVKSVQTDRSAKSVPTDPSKKSALADRKVQTVPVTRLRENVRVTVENYADLAKDATASQPITLWINGRDSTLVAEEIVPGGTSATLSYQLERTSENQDLWKTLLEDPFDPSHRPITISVGLSGTKPIDGQLEVSLLKTEKDRAIWWFLALALLVILFCILAVKTDIVRNGPRVTVNGVRKQQAYSLGRCQMAWWFFLILVGYVAIWQICGDQDTITTSLLALMGISAGTALGSAAIDSSAGSSKRTKLLEEQTSLEKQLADTQAQIASVGGATALAAKALVATETKLAARLAAIPGELAALDVPALSQFWLLDLLRDDDGNVALHRFQIFIWTLVLGGMFLASVFTTLTMPQFSGTMLALMGISSGTYLGFKLPTAQG